MYARAVLKTHPSYVQVTNYELGIVFPIKDVQHADKLACWLRPPNKYGSRDEPWVSSYNFVYPCVLIVDD